MMSKIIDIKVKYSATRLYVYKCPQCKKITESTIDPTLNAQLCYDCAINGEYSL